MDYSEFEHRVIKITDSKGNEYGGLIVGCDYDIGVSIVQDDVRDFYLLCLRGPSSGMGTHDTDRDRAFYNEIFENMIAMFQEGFLDYRILQNIKDKFNVGYTSYPSPDTCAFNK